MKKLVLLAVVAVGLTGCYSYSTTRTMTPEGRTCEYKVTKTGNRLFGYSDNSLSHERRADYECERWVSGRM